MSASSDPATRILAEGRLVVILRYGGMIRASVLDGSDVYALGFGARGQGWWCACPGESENCVHLESLRRVTVRDPEVWPVPDLHHQGDAA